VRNQESDVEAAGEETRMQQPITLVAGGDAQLSAERESGACPAMRGQAGDAGGRPSAPASGTVASAATAMAIIALTQPKALISAWLSEHELAEAAPRVDEAGR
jgi:hypothetical protein